MSELNLTLNLQDRRLISLYETGNHQLLIRAATKKIKLGKQISSHLALRGLAYHSSEKFALAHNDFMKAIELGLRTNTLIRLAKESMLYAKFLELLDSFYSEKNNKKYLFELGQLVSAIDPVSIKAFTKEKLEMLKSLYIQLMRTEGSAEPNELTKRIFKLIKADPIFKRFQDTTKNQGRHTIEKQRTLLSQLSSDPLFSSVLCYYLCVDREIEDVVRSIRKFCLLKSATHEIKDDLFDLICSISVQVFLNEFIYDADNEELQEVSLLIARVRGDLTRKQCPSEWDLLKISLYQDLNSFDLDPYRNELGRLKLILKKHIDDRREEQKIANKIKKSKAINNFVSKIVRQQYEENPYPRWESAKFNFQPRDIKSIHQKHKTNLEIKHIDKKSEINLLVAGCGTGQEPIKLAKNIRNVKIDAVDISLRSLSYSKRKAEEMNVKNITFFHEDILNLSSSSKKYDIIYSSGVLHHMEDPSHGLSVLAKLLEDSGYMHLALYSSLSRRGLKEIQDIIKGLNLDPNSKNIRSIREFFLKKQFKDKSLLHIATFTDFFSTSEFRDLLLHEKEHTFSLLEIEKLLEENSLKFCGFSNVNTLPHAELDERTLFELKSWDAIEKKNPNLFSNMYQFYCQRKH